LGVPISDILIDMLFGVQYGEPQQPVPVGPSDLMNTDLCPPIGIPCGRLQPMRRLRALSYAEGDMSSMVSIEFATNFTIPNAVFSSSAAALAFESLVNTAAYNLANSNCTQPAFLNTIAAIGTGMNVTAHVGDTEIDIPADAAAAIAGAHNHSSPGRSPEQLAGQIIGITVLILVVLGAAALFGFHFMKRRKEKSAQTSEVTSRAHKSVNVANPVVGIALSDDQPAMSHRSFRSLNAGSHDVELPNLSK
jgi:hypothetical protein